MQDIVTIKTKNPVVYNALSQDVGIIYMGVSSVTFNANDAYTAYIYYYTLIEGDNIYMNNKNIISSTVVGFTVQEADTIFEYIQTKEPTFTGMYKQLITTATILGIAQGGSFGLTGDNREIHEEALDAN